MSYLFETGSGWQQTATSRHHPSSSSSVRNPSSRHKPAFLIDDARSQQQQMGPPAIDESHSSGNVSVVVGKQIILGCAVRDIGNESVSSYY